MDNSKLIEDFQDLQVQLRRYYKMVASMVPERMIIDPQATIKMTGAQYLRLRDNLFCLQADAEDIYKDLLPPPPPPPPDGEHVIDFKQERTKRRNKPTERKNPL